MINKISGYSINTYKNKSQKVAFGRFFPDNRYVKTEEESVLKLAADIKSGLQQGQFKHLGKIDANTYRFEVFDKTFDYMPEARGMYSNVKSGDFYVINSDNKEYYLKLAKLLDPVIDEYNKRFKLGMPVKEVIKTIPQAKAEPINPNYSQIMYFPSRVAKHKALNTSATTRNISNETALNMLTGNFKQTPPVKQQSGAKFLDGTFDYNKQPVLQKQAVGYRYY